MSKNPNKDFLNNLNHNFFKDQKQDNGTTPMVAYNEAGENLNKNYKNVKFFMCCWVMKNGDNYEVHSDGSDAELLGMLES